MIDPHTVELMNLEIDGALDATGREELRSALENDPRAGEMYAELCSVVHLLETSPAVAPPENLRTEIAAAIGRTRVLPFDTGLRRKHLVPLRIAAGIAAGLLLVFLIQPDLFQKISVPDLRGTMRQVTAHRPITASIVASGDMARTSVKLELHQPAIRSIELHFDPDAVQLERVEGRAAVDNATAGTATIRGAQPPAITLVFRRLTGNASRVSGRVSEKDLEPYELNVVLPPVPTN